MDEKEIKIALIKTGLKQSDIARKLGVTPQSVNQVVKRKIRSRRIEKELERIVRQAS